MFRIARFTAVALAVLTAVALCAAPVPKGANLRVAVAYIHAANEKAAGAFKTVLDTEGFTVALLKHDAVAKADLTKYGLLVVGNDTENSAWGDAAPIVRPVGEGCEILQLRWGLVAERPKAPPVINFRSEGRRFANGCRRRTLRIAPPCSARFGNTTCERCSLQRSDLPRPCGPFTRSWQT